MPIDLAAQPQVIPEPASGDKASRDAAYVLPADSLARQRIVALGQDLVVDGEARSHAVVLSGNARVSGSVHGDLIVLGGDAHLLPGASIGGNVYV
ncbi:MAG: polymer-forming cytoskeletal protein, partial [Acidobacteriota bacterium]